MQEQTIKAMFDDAREALRGVPDDLVEEYIAAVVAVILDKSQGGEAWRRYMDARRAVILSGKSLQVMKSMQWVGMASFEAFAPDAAQVARADGQVIPLEARR